MARRRQIPPPGHRGPQATANSRSRTFRWAFAGHPTLLPGHPRLHRPSHRAARVHIQYHGKKQRSLQRPDVVQILRSTLIRCRRLELLLQHIRRNPCIGSYRTVPGQSPLPQPRHKALAPHQSLDLSSRTAHRPGLQIQSDATHTIGRVTLGKAATDGRQHLRVTPRPMTHPPFAPRIVAASRYAQCLAHHRQRPHASMLRHERLLQPDTLAKYAAAFLSGIGSITASN